MYCTYYICILQQWNGDWERSCEGKAIPSPFSDELPCRSVRSIRSWETRWRRQWWWCAPKSKQRRWRSCHAPLARAAVCCRLQNLKLPIWDRVGSSQQDVTVASSDPWWGHDEGTTKTTMATKRPCSERVAWCCLYIVHSASYLKCKTRPKTHQHVQVWFGMIMMDDIGNVWKCSC